MWIDDDTDLTRFAGALSVSVIKAVTHKGAYLEFSKTQPGGKRVIVMIDALPK